MTEYAQYLLSTFGRERILEGLQEMKNAAADTATVVRPSEKGSIGILTQKDGEQ